MDLKQRIGIILGLVIMLSTVSVFADGTFLCMRPGENVAITADDMGNYRYITMKASNDADVYPQMSSDGNTYLPLRYICEKAGIKDGSKISGELPDGYFRYSISEESGKQEIAIRYNNQYYCNTVGEEFQYSVSDDDIRTVSIYNIEGSLYAPMTYIAKITNSKAVWQRDLNQIMFISNALNPEDYIDSNNRLIREKEMWLEFNYYNNNIGNSALYLKTDGNSLSDLSSESGVKTGAKSVTRSGNILYYVNDCGKVMTKVENMDDETELLFRDKNGVISEFYANTAIVIQDKLYGISCDDGNLSEGRLFRSELDGTNLEYLTDVPIYNLILKKNQLDYFLFYCEALNKSTIHMIRLKTMDDYTVEITDHDRIGMIKDIKQFAIGKKSIVYIDSTDLMHVISTEFRLEDIEIQRLDNSAHKTFDTSDNGDDIRNPDSMNYDYINNVLYIEKNGRVYYYTPVSNSFRFLYSEGTDIKQFSLISDKSYNDCIAGVAGGNLTFHRVRYNCGDVELIDGGG